MLDELFFIFLSTAVYFMFAVFVRNDIKDKDYPAAAFHFMAALYIAFYLSAKLIGGL